MPVHSVWMLVLEGGFTGSCPQFFGWVSISGTGLGQLRSIQGRNFFKFTISILQRKLSLCRHTDEVVRGL